MAILKESENLCETCRHKETLRYDISVNSKAKSTDISILQTEVTCIGVKGSHNLKGKSFDIKRCSGYVNQLFVDIPVIDTKELFIQQNKEEFIKSELGSDVLKSLEEGSTVTGEARKLEFVIELLKEQLRNTKDVLEILKRPISFGVERKVNKQGDDNIDATRYFRFDVAIIGSEKHSPKDFEKHFIGSWDDMIDKESQDKNEEIIKELERKNKLRAYKIYTNTGQLPIGGEDLSLWRNLLKEYSKFLTENNLFSSEGNYTLKWYMESFYNYKENE